MKILAMVNGKRSWVEGTIEELEAAQAAGKIQFVEEPEAQAVTPIVQATPAAQPATLVQKFYNGKPAETAKKEKKNLLKAIDPAKVKDSTMLLHDAGGRAYSARKWLSKEVERRGLVNKTESAVIAGVVVASVKLAEVLMSDKAA